MDETEEAQDRPRRREGGRFVELAIDDENGDRAQNDAGESGATAQDLEPLIEHADLRELVEANRANTRAGRAERTVDLAFTPSRDLRHQRQNDRRRMALGRFLERLRADQHADIKKDRQNRDDGNKRHHQRDHAEPRKNDDEDSGRGGIADASAHRLPTGVADIDGVDEGIAHEAADETDDTIGGQYLRRRKGIARGRGAFDIVHRLDEIIDAEGDRRDENDAQ